MGEGNRKKGAKEERVREGYQEVRRQREGLKGMAELECRKRRGL